MTLLLLIALGGCGGREAKPVATRSALDDQLSCTHLQGEYSANRARLGDLVREDGDKARNNVGFLLLTSPLAMDLSDTSGRETAALTARNQRLRELAVQRGCPDAVPAAP